MVGAFCIPMKAFDFLSRNFIKSLYPCAVRMKNSPKTCLNRFFFSEYSNWLELIQNNTRRVLRFSHHFIRSFLLKAFEIICTIFSSRRELLLLRCILWERELYIPFFHYLFVKIFYWQRTSLFKLFEKRSVFFSAQAILKLKLHVFWMLVRCNLLIYIHILFDYFHRCLGFEEKAMNSIW